MFSSCVSMNVFAYNFHAIISLQLLLEIILLVLIGIHCSKIIAMAGESAVEQEETMSELGFVGDDYDDTDVKVIRELDLDDGEAVIFTSSGAGGDEGRKPSPGRRNILVTDAAWLYMNDLMLNILFTFLYLPSILLQMLPFFMGIICVIVKC